MTMHFSRSKAATALGGLRKGSCQRVAGSSCLFGCIFEICDQVVPILLLLQSAKRHLGSWDVLLWVLEVGKQGILLPCDTLRLIRFRVGEPVDLTGLPPKKTVKLRSDLVAFIGAEGMALRASCLEEACALFLVT